MSADVRYAEIDTDHTPLDTGTQVSFADAVNRVADRTIGRSK